MAQRNGTLTDKGDEAGEKGRLGHRWCPTMLVE
jgi:hypothetical protein